MNQDGQSGNILSEYGCRCDIVGLILSLQVFCIINISTLAEEAISPQIFYLIELPYKGFSMWYSALWKLCSVARKEN